MTNRHTTLKHYNRRTATEDGTHAEGQAATPSPAQSLEILRNPQADAATRGAALVDLQRVVGNGVVGRGMVRRQREITFTDPDIVVGEPKLKKDKEYYYLKKTAEQGVKIYLERHVGNITDATIAALSDYGLWVYKYQASKVSDASKFMKKNIGSFMKAGLTAVFPGGGLVITIASSICKKVLHSIAKEPKSVDALLEILRKISDQARKDSKESIKQSVSEFRGNYNTAYQNSIEQYIRALKRGWKSDKDIVELPPSSERVLKETGEFPSKSSMHKSMLASLTRLTLSKDKNVKIMYYSHQIETLSKVEALRQINDPKDRERLYELERGLPWPDRRLLSVNHEPKGQFMVKLDLSAAEADKLIRSRERHGSFQNTYGLVTRKIISGSKYNKIKKRLVLGTRVKR